MLSQGSEVENPDVAMTRKPDDAEPFSGLAFKIMADPFVGTLTFVRIYRCSMISSNFFLRLCDKGGYRFSILDYAL